MQPYLKILADGGRLSADQAEAAMHLMLRGEAELVEMAGLLMGLRARGEDPMELVGFTRAMRQHAVHVELDDPHAIDLCGTGGDSSGTFNISTAASFVCAGAGVTVAKHGNRSVSSKAGSADVLEALGVQIELRKAGVEYCLREARIAFLFAPFFHPAMRHVMPVRKQLGVRTFFNILGPLCNPAGVRRQLVGAFSPEVAQLMASILASLDAERIVTVHAADGLDEVSLSAPSTVFEYQQGQDRPKARQVEPEQHGVGRVGLDRLLGGDARANAEIIRGILDGRTGPPRDVVVLNAGYALWTSGRYDDLDASLDAARDSIDSGGARRALDRLVEVSHAAPRD